MLVKTPKPALPVEPSPFLASNPTIFVPSNSSVNLFIFPSTWIAWPFYIKRRDVGNIEYLLQTVHIQKDKSSSVKTLKFLQKLKKINVT